MFKDPKIKGVQFDIQFYILTQKIKCCWTIPPVIQQRADGAVGSFRRLYNSEPMGMMMFLCHVPDMNPRCVHPDVYTSEDPIGVVTAIRDLSD